MNGNGPRPQKTAKSERPMPNRSGKGRQRRWRMAGEFETAPKRCRSSQYANIKTRFLPADYGKRSIFAADRPYWSDGKGRSERMNMETLEKLQRQILEQNRRIFHKTPISQATE